MLVADQPITLYHRSYDEAKRADVWTRAVYMGSWYGSQAVTVADSGLLTADTYTVRIPTQDAVTAAAGDIIVKGEVQDTPTGATALTRKYQGRCFVVTRVQDNRRGAPALQHWRIEGK